MRSPSRCEDAFLIANPGIVIAEELELAVAAFIYDGSLRRALSALKYSGARRLAPILAELAAPCFAELVSVTGSASLVPVPVHPERARERGYNQAAILARELGRTVHMPLVECIERALPTAKQHRLNRAARLRNLRGAFRPKRPSPATVILVDDIITTSATLEACAAVLRSAGAESVYGFAVAREI